MATNTKTEVVNLHRNDWQFSKEQATQPTILCEHFQLLQPTYETISLEQTKKTHVVFLSHQDPRKRAVAPHNSPSSIRSAPIIALCSRRVSSSSTSDNSRLAAYLLTQKKKKRKRKKERKKEKRKWYWATDKRSLITKLLDEHRPMIAKPLAQSLSMHVPNDRELVTAFRSSCRHLQSNMPKIFPTKYFLKKKIF